MVAADASAIDPEAVVESVTEFLASYLADAGAAGYVVGVSGGLDSAVAATLAARAVGPDRVTGLVLPGAPSDPSNMADARSLCADLDVTRRDVDVEPVVDAVTGPLGDLETATVGNVRARARMVLLYAVANEADLLVIGPGNRTERALGYFTKWGDGASDVAPLGELYKTEVAAVGRRLGLDRFVEKTPTAGLWPGQTDAGELGADYATVDAVLRGLLAGRSVAAVAADTGHDEALVRDLAARRRDTAHKRRWPPTAAVDRTGD